MAAISTQWSAPSWIPSIAYPTIAAIALVLCVAIIARRFRERIEATHEERWARRRARQNPAAQDNKKASESDT